MCLHELCSYKCGFGYHIIIPTLEFYNEQDKNVDPMQRAQAYKNALEESGNEGYRIKIIERAGHTLTPE